MASKKYLIILASIFTLFSFTQVNAQSSGVYNLTSYDYTDSSLIPEKRMDQQNDFMNDRYLYPSKPRNQWEVGISFGGLNISGDVTSRSIFNQAHEPLKTMGFALNVRKAWGYVISTRLQYLSGSASGYNYKAATGYGIAGNANGQNPWVSNNYNGNVYYNYQTKIRQIGLDMMVALNNIRYHRSSNKTSFYGLAGVGALMYDARVNAQDGTGSYQAGFNTIHNKYSGNGNSAYEDRKDISGEVKDLFDDSYETKSEGRNGATFMDDYVISPSVNLGLGVSFRLGKRVSLNIEDKLIMSGSDLLDAQRWEERTSLTSQTDNINYFSVGIGVNVGNNAVAPLWWVNPNDFMYNGLANVNQPTGKCDADSDGDGVSDCYDRCGDTPGGVAVDTHGCPLDTDGDGVADYKDKQLITPTECQPSDANGIGKCPCPGPECGPVITEGDCSTKVPGGSVMFSGGSRSLSSSAKNMLNNLANSMRSNPNCNVVVMGNGSSSKVAQQRSWDRVNAVINYMVDRNGIDRGRFIFQYGLGGNPNAVDYRAAGNGESGPSNTPPPFPNLKRN